MSVPLTASEVLQTVTVKPKVFNDSCEYSANRPRPRGHQNLRREELKLWINVIKELFLKLELRPADINTILRDWVPRRHRHAITPVSEPPPVPPHTFHRFSDLPYELRIAIWDLTSIHPRQLLAWPCSRWVLNAPAPIKNTPPLQKRMLAVGLACKEAWGVVSDKGRSYRPPDLPSTVDKKFRLWVSSDDVVFLGHRLGLNRFSRKGYFHILHDHKEVAIYYYDHVFLVPEIFRHRLRGMRHPETIVVVLGEFTARMLTDPSMTERRRDQKRHPLPRGGTDLVKLVQLDQVDELNRFKRLWESRKSQRDWIEGHVSFTGAVPGCQRSEDAPCLVCTLRRWHAQGMDPIRTSWIELHSSMLVGSDEFQLCDIYPDGLRQNPNWEHPWVKETLATMPTIKPAVEFRFVTARAMQS